MKKPLIYLMAFVYCLAGINHFINPGFYKKIMPEWLPFHYPLIYISGAAEILLGVLLLPKASRKFAGWGLILLLLAVFPANIQMTVDYANQHHPQLWVSIVRLPVQGLLIYWAYLATRPEPHKRLKPAL